MFNFIKKHYIKLISHIIRDKEERRIWRYNKLHDDCILLKGNSYIIKPNIMAPETKIGKYVSIAQNVVIGLGNHPINFISTNPCFYSNDQDLSKELNKPCYIGNDVWIGRNVMIKNGIKIGNGAIIGAGAVVTKDVPDYAIVAGVPAKIIKYRFDENTIKLLLESKWWDYPFDVIKNLDYQNPIHFIEQLKEIKNEI